MGNRPRLFKTVMMKDVKKAFKKIIYDQKPEKSSGQKPEAAPQDDLGVSEVFEDCVHEVGCLLETCRCSRMNPVQSTGSESRSPGLGSQTKLAQNILGDKSTRLLMAPQRKQE